MPTKSPDPSSSHPDRRDFLKSAVGTSAAAAVVAGSVGESQAQKNVASAQSNLIQKENAKPGTTDWQLTRTRVNEGKYRTSLIEGYCSHQSIKAGETLRVFVSAKPARQFTIDIYRMGYYAGTGGRHLTQLGPFDGETQAVPEMTPAPKRLRECKWRASTELEIPTDWPSGVYLGKLTTIPESESEPYWQSYIIFIVKDDRPADILFQNADWEKIRNASYGIGS